MSGTDSEKLPVNKCRVSGDEFDGYNSKLALVSGILVFLLSIVGFVMTIISSVKKINPGAGSAGYWAGPNAWIGAFFMILCSCQKMKVMSVFWNSLINTFVSLAGFLVPLILYLTNKGDYLDGSEAAATPEIAADKEYIFRYTNLTTAGMFAGCCVLFIISTYNAGRNRKINCAC